nr:hypothetical protein [Tanacetum cinerariifolium]
RAEVYYECMEPFKSLMYLWVRSKSIAAIWLEKVVTPLIDPIIKGFAAASAVLASQSRQSTVIKDDPNITMEEYIRLEEEKDRKNGKVYNWETATYGCILYTKEGFHVVIFMVILIVVVVAIVGVVIAVAIIGVVVVVGWAYTLHKDKASLVRVPVANVTLSSSPYLLRENFDSSGGGVIDLTGYKDPTYEDGDTGMDYSTGVSASLGGEISSGGRKYLESNSDNTGGITVGEAIRACSGGIEYELIEQDLKLT